MSFDEPTYCQQGRKRIKCVIKEQKRFVFEVSNVENDLYTIEILINKNRGQLGHYILPRKINVQKLKDILSHYVITDENSIKNSMKHFIKICKCHIECYVCRKKQVEDLEVIKNASLTKR